MTDTPRTDILRARFKAAIGSRQARAHEAEAINLADALERELAAAKRGAPAEIRLKADDALDEVVGSGVFHLEQMSDTGWWMLLGDVHVWLNSDRAITAYYERESEEIKDTEK